MLRSELLRQIIIDLDDERNNQFRGDRQRELSIALTHLETAALWLAHADKFTRDQSGATPAMKENDR